MIVIVAFPGLAGTGGEENRAAEPSVRQFSAWLDVFNSGDRERYAKFLADSLPARLALLDQEMAFREFTGGFDLRKLERLSATEVSGLVQERASDQFARFELTVAATGPHVIASLDLTAIPRPAEFAIARLTQGEAIAGIQAVLSKDAARDRFQRRGAGREERPGAVQPRLWAGGSRTRDPRIPSRRGFASGR